MRLARSRAAVMAASGAAGVAAGGAVAYSYDAIPQTALPNVRALDVASFFSHARHAGPLPDLIANMRFNERMPNPSNPQFRIAIVEYR